MQNLIYRIAVSSLLLIGHGLPKIFYWWFGVSLWGAHQEYLPSSVASAMAAIIECFCPILIILGFYTRTNAALIAGMLTVSAFARPYPFFFYRVAVEGEPYAIVLSRSIHLYVAASFLAVILMTKVQKKVSCEF